MVLVIPARHEMNGLRTALLIGAYACTCQVPAISTEVVKILQEKKKKSFFVLTQRMAVLPQQISQGQRIRATARFYQCRCLRVEKSARANKRKYRACPPGCLVLSWWFVCCAPQSWTRSICIVVLVQHESGAIVQLPTIQNHFTRLPLSARKPGVEYNIFSFFVGRPEA